MSSLTFKLKDRIKENFKRNKVALFLFVIIWPILIYLTLNNYSSTLGKQSSGNDLYDRSVIELEQNTFIEEEVPIEEDVDSVAVLFATYARNNVGQVFIKVEGVNSHNVYADVSYDVKDVQDNAYLTIDLHQRPYDRGDRSIRVEISSNSVAGSGIGVYYTNLRYFDHSSFMINGEVLKDNDLCIRFLAQDDQLKHFSDSVIGVTIVVLTLLILIELLLRPKAEVFFALLALSLGLIMMVIINPSSPPDELSHYEVVMQLVNKMLFIEDYRTIDSVYLKYGGMYGHYNISAGYLRFLKDFGEMVNMTGVLEPLARNIDEVYFVQYIPNAIGLALGRLIGLNMITTFYLGRLTGLLFYVLCVYIAVKKIPTYKFLLGLICCLPMPIQTAMSITYDTFIMGMTILTLAFFTKWYFEDKKITIGEYIFVLAVCLLLSPAKIIYGFYSFLFFLVPADRYGGMKKKLLMVLILCSGTAYQFFKIARAPIKELFKRLSSLANSKYVILAEEIRNNINEGNELIKNGGIPKPEDYSFYWVFKHPLQTLDIFYRTIRYRIKFWFYGSIGSTLSGDTLVLPLRLVHILVATVFAGAFVKQDIVYPLPIKGVMIFICIVIGLFAMIGMFTSWTDPEQEIVEDFGGIIVEGIQGRYFSPILPHFFSIFANKKFSLPKKADSYVLIAYLLIFFEIVIYVLSYTFVN